MKVAVISGKGGSGKSSVTAAFVALSQQVVAVDCDVDASNLPLLFEGKRIYEEPFASEENIVVDAAACVGCGICVDKCAFNALEMGPEGVAVPKDFMCEGCGLCVRLCPRKALTLVGIESSTIFTSVFEKGVMIHGQLNPGDDNSGKMIARLRSIADQAMIDRNIELQILDGPPGIGCPVISTVTGVDRVVMVAEPTLSGISDLKRAYKVAHSFCKDVFVIINKCDSNPNNSDLIMAYCKENGIPVVGKIPFDRRWVEAQLHCQSMVDYAPESEGAHALKQAYSRVFLS